MVSVILKVSPIDCDYGGSVLLAVGGNDLCDLWAGVILEGGVEVLVGQLCVIPVTRDGDLEGDVHGNIGWGGRIVLALQTYPVLYRIKLL